MDKRLQAACKRPPSFLMERHFSARKNWIFIFALLLSACASSPFSGSNPFEHTELLLEAEEALDEQISDSGAGIPQELLGHTKAIVVFPNLVKAAVIAGARVGKGVVIVRSPKTGKWNPPAFIKSRQTSLGLQAGIQEAELRRPGFS